MLYRSSRICFLLTTFLNVWLGVYLRNDTPVVKPVAQMFVSGIVLLAPLVLLAGFFLEPGLDQLFRAYTLPTLYAVFGTGIVLPLLRILSHLRH